MNLPVTVFRFVYYFVRKQQLLFLALILSSICWAISDAVFPYFFKQVIDVVSGWQSDRTQVYQAVKIPLIWLALFWVGAELAMRMQGILQIYTFPRFRAEIREAVFDYVKSHSHEFFSSQFSGSLARKLADLPKSCQGIMEIIALQFVTAATGAIIVMWMMWFASPIFSFILFVWFCFHILLTLVFMRGVNALWQEHSEAVSTLSGRIVDIFTNMQSVRLFASAEHEGANLIACQSKEIVRAKKAMWLSEGMRFALGLNGLVLIFGMLFVLLHGWVHGWVTIGDFAQISMQSFWLLGWVWYITFQLSVFSREVGVTADALSLVRKAHDLTDKQNASPIIIRRGEIRFENVFFAYRKNRTIFENLNVTIYAGEKLGLVGTSGSGKTTFVNLILRFYDIKSGRITIDGQNIADVQCKSLRSQIAMIPQDTSLFNRTIMENIRYGRLDATDDEVVQASKLAHCHEFIEKMDAKYNTVAGERGLNLSGGQRQRIAIARAILKNAPILILDEATSALDSVTERLIQDSLHHLMQGRTAIVVAHRLSTLADMDRIVVFHKGSIIEEGTHDQLLALNGRFAELWNMQADGFLPDDEENELEELDENDENNDKHSNEE